MNRSLYTGFAISIELVHTAKAAWPWKAIATGLAQRPQLSIESRDSYFGHIEWSGDAIARPPTSRRASTDAGLRMVAETLYDLGFSARRWDEGSDIPF